MPATRPDAEIDCNFNVNNYNTRTSHPWLNWIEHRPPKAGIARSNRAGCARNLTAAWRFNLFGLVLFVLFRINCGKRCLI